MIKNVLKVHRFDLKDIDLIKRYENLHRKCEFAFFQQSVAWAHSIKDFGPDVPIFLLCEINNIDVAGIPIYLFSGKYGNIMTSIPQPGPVGGLFHADNISNDVKNTVYKSIFDEVIKISREFKCLLFSTNTNQIFDDSLIYKKMIRPQYILNNFTQYINLQENQSRSTSLNHNVNRSKKIGLEFLIDDNLFYFNEWYNIHIKRSKEIGIYPLNQDLLQKLLQNSNNVKLACVFLKKKIISGCIFIFHKKILDLYMISYDSLYKQFKPNYFCIDNIISIAKNLNIQYFNWQSSNYISSGVYNFKKSWGSKHSDYQIITKIFTNISELRKIGIKNIMNAYPNHYLLPWSAFKKYNRQKIFYKGEK